MTLEEEYQEEEERISKLEEEARQLNGSVHFLKEHLKYAKENHISISGVSVYRWTKMEQDFTNNNLFGGQQISGQQRGDFKFSFFGIAGQTYLGYGNEW